MRERPILFSGPLIRALLDGRKTQTRRLVKHNPSMGWPEDWCKRAVDGPAELEKLVGPIARFCHVGMPGDRLWVRETWHPAARLGDEVVVEYRADESERTIAMPWAVNVDRQVVASRWIPSIHMPRWASRITLEVTSVRLERLQSISEEDARAEGFAAAWQERLRVAGADGPLGRPHPVGWFAAIWDEVYGAGAWKRNDWVWVVGFRRVEVGP